MDKWFLPGLILLIVGTGLIKGVPVYEAFIEGAKEGLKTAVSILPYMIAMLSAIYLMQRSGLLSGLTQALMPVFHFLGIPDSVVPLMLLRPFSGSASLAMLQNIMDTQGTDSRAGLVACTLMGSTETIFYTCALYLGAAGVKKSRYAIPAALAAWLTGSIAAGMFYQ
jgi:spore maturation protein B